MIYADTIMVAIPRDYGEEEVKIAAGEAYAPIAYAAVGRSYTR